MPTPGESRRIQLRAYQIWQQEGWPHGRELEHWRLAEQQIEVEFRVGFPDASADEGAAADRSGAS
jgi:hypothetical protein